VFQIGESLLRFEAPVMDQPTLPPNLPNVARKLQVPHLTDLVGKSMGVFRLDKIITQTQSGMLFLGRDTEHDQAVAVKVLAPDLANLETQKQRFVRAMKTMLPLKHPNIVRILNAGKSGPFCWTAMEYIDGENMTQLIERVGIDGMLDWREVLRVAVHVTRALQFAFEKKIVHRNVTPTNILRRKSDRVCLVGDLMLAKALEGSTATMLTEPGGLIGEVAYMAPERTYPSGAADTRSDMYGLGATLYALLTGRPPYAADALADLLRQIRDNVPFPPREYQFSINSEFEDLVMKLLAKRPDQRFPVPAQLLRELERIGRFSNVELDAAK
jgi:serine/threonine protein kinase